MKKTFCFCLALVLLLTFVCCFAEAHDPESESRKGWLTMCGVSEEEYHKLLATQNAGVHRTRPVFFDTLDSMVLALETGDIESASLGEGIGQYIQAHSNGIIVDKTYTDYNMSYRMLLRPDYEELLGKVNQAISELGLEGTLDALKETYIAGFIEDGEPEAIEMPVFDGAETYTVAVTGDLPPMDFVRPDTGTPAGFNTALLAAISEKLGVNFKLISITSAARPIALASGQADIIFWVTAEDEPLFGKFTDVPEGMLMTDCYYREPLVRIAKDGNQ